MHRKKIEPWKLIVGVASIAFIIFMLAKKDIFAVYSTLPKEQALPLIATTIAVSLFKVTAISAIILAAQWIIGKFRR